MTGLLHSAGVLLKVCTLVSWHPSVLQYWHPLSQDSTCMVNCCETAAVIQITYQNDIDVDISNQPGILDFHG